MVTAHSPHTFATRLAHLAIAILVIVQIATSQVMTAPGAGTQSDNLFTAHESGGLAALILTLAFWILIVVRHAGTEPAVLVPWFFRVRRKALLDDATRHFAAWRRLRLAEHLEHGAFPGAIHGLGLLIVLVMALTGTLWFVAGLAGAEAAPIGDLAIAIHAGASSLAIAYVVGHAAFALLNHIARTQSLADMWRLRGPPRS